MLSRHQWLALALVSLLSIMHTTAYAAPDVRYITGSYVNVRAQSSRHADIVDRLIVNTPVTLLSQSADYCEINWNGDRQGFTACDLIGKQPIRIEDVGAKYLFDANNNPIIDGTGYPKPNPNYSPLRAFWLEPTVERLFDAGKYFEEIALPASQLAEERGHWSQGMPKLRRFPLPEFDAMKALLMRGVVSPRSQYVAPVAWKDIQAFLMSPDDVGWERIRKFAPHGLYFGPNGDINREERERYAAKYRGVGLPLAKPSFFKSLGDIGRPGDGTEALSAQFGVPFQMRVLSGPKWGGDNNSYPLLVGAWDVGEVETSLAKPVYDVAIGVDGQVSVGETVVVARNNHGDSSLYCIETFKQPDGRKLLDGYKRIREPWIFFRLLTPPALTHAKVTIVGDSPSEGADGDAGAGANILSGKKRGNHTSPFRVKNLVGRETAGYIDLDNDGIVDLAIWDDGNGEDAFPGHVRQRIIFANVMGKWYLLDTDRIEACNC